MDNAVSIIIAAVAILFLFLLFKLLKTPIKWAFKLLLNGLMGFVILFIVNWLGGFVGISLGVNWVNALVAGLLGTPGVVLLLLVKYVL
jgi:inhibitor of the pro-sigma K processing machinery